MMYKKIFLTALMVIASVSSANAQGLSTKSKRKTALPPSIACPPVIGDKRNSTQSASANPKSRNNPYMCFRNAKDAAGNGFMTTKKASSVNYTGWYRTALKISRNTCDTTLTQGGPVLFLQLKEKDNAAFGEFCPHLGQYIGVQTENGLLLSGTEERNTNSAFSICDDGKVTVRTFVELTQVVDASMAYSIKYKEVHSCKSAASSGNFCSKEFTGQAILETSHVWPPIPETTDGVFAACDLALKGCGSLGCHPGIDFSNIKP